MFNLIIYVTNNYDVNGVNTATKTTQNIVETVECMYEDLDVSCTNSDYSHTITVSNIDVYTLVAMTERVCKVYCNDGITTCVSKV